ERRVSSIRRTHQAEDAPAIGKRKPLLLGAGFGMVLIGRDPALKGVRLIDQRTVDRAVRQALRSSGAAAFAGLEDRGAAGGIFLDQRALPDVGEDLQVFCRIEQETRARSETFFVERFQGMKP